MEEGEEFQIVSAATWSEWDPKDRLMQGTYRALCCVLHRPLSMVFECTL